MTRALRKPAQFENLLLFRLSRILASGGAPVIRLCEGRYGITRREWRVIASLQSAKRMLSSELAEHLQLDRARTSRAITSLVAKGLLQRHGVAGDQRKAAVEMTDKGRKLYAELFPQVQEINAGLLGALSDSEIALLDNMLSAVQSQAERMGMLDGLPKADRRRGRKLPPP
ncbi:MAG: MarR family transcriptional regulator [Betaproteobacteria bacterium]|jgi:DNA-binding MarR family transcriptional regulator|nr:MarR family transcriptional regulator [Betaproteobacteria bacterium]MBP6646352.1 MarR family transcriptional regulator [Burkholderiaceae bacterium]